MSVATATAEPIEEANIALLVETDPSIVIREPDKWVMLRERIKSDIAGQVPDLSTKKGRDEIRTLAADVTRSKTAVDRARKRMTEEFRLKTAEVNKIGGEIVDTLDSLAELARRPLTEWEKAEDERITRVREDIAAFKANAVIHVGMTAGGLLERINDLKAQPVEENVFRDRYAEAIEVKAASLAVMTAAHERLIREEADRAELDRLRKAEEDRQREEAARRAAAEAEQRRKDAEEAEQKRIAAAAEKARLDAIAGAERRAREEREALEARHAAELKAEQDKAAAAERARQAEADRIAQEKSAQEAEAKRQAHEDAARQADKHHRATIMREIKEALMREVELDESTAKGVVLAIVGGSVPHVTIQF